MVQFSKVTNVKRFAWISAAFGRTVFCSLFFSAKRTGCMMRLQEDICRKQFSNHKHKQSNRNHNVYDLTTSWLSRSNNYLRKVTADICLVLLYLGICSFAKLQIMVGESPEVLNYQRNKSRSSLPPSHYQSNINPSLLLLQIDSNDSENAVEKLWLGGWNNKNSPAFICLVNENFLFLIENVGQEEINLS